MINLLEAPAKRDLKAARMNVVLATYCGIVALSLVCVLLLVIFSQFWLTGRIDTANSKKRTNDALSAQYADVSRQATTFSTNLGKIKSVLNNRTHYNTALLNIAASLPPGASIGTVTLSPTFVTTPLQIIAMTSSNQAALALKQKLSASPIYSKVSLDSVNCGGVNGNNCAVSLTATLKPTSIFTPGATQ